MIEFIQNNPIFVASAYIACMFLIQAVSIVVAVWLGSKIAKGEPLVERKDAYMDVLTLPEEKEMEHEIEEPFVSWKPRMAENEDAEN